MRVATVAAGVLAAAAAAMAVAAFTTGDEREPVSARGTEPAAAPEPATAAQSAAAAEPAAARAGEAVWVAQGCGSCHTFAAASATGVIGPDLSQTLRGMPASYIRESIVAPAKALAAGYEGGAMPEDFAARMSPTDLDRLVAFIRSGVPD